jgi:imidazolonepropionase-like amidohydrolase
MKPPSPKSLILRNGVHIDGSGPDPLGVVDILVEGGLIREISDRAIRSASAVEIDLKGRTVMPGLIDCHVHATLFEDDLQSLRQAPPSYTALRAAAILRQMLERGFTTVRDAAGADWGLRDAVSQGHVTGPRLFISGRAIGQTGGHGDFRARNEGDGGCSCANALRQVSRIADGNDEVRRAVREELRQGADQIKLMASGGLSGAHERLLSRQLSEGELRTAVEEVTASGTYVMAHAYSAEAIRYALESGVRTIEHGNLIDADVAAMASAKAAFVVPTLVTYWLPPEIAAEASPETAESHGHLLEKGLGAVETCRRAGVSLGFGTDLIGSSHRHQGREFLIRREAQPAHEIIASATRVNAEILQRSGLLGVLRPGACADIIVVDGDPLKDISLLSRTEQSLALIIKGGAVFKNTLTQV